MNYTEVVATAINYSDRKDTRTAASVDSFLRIVESRVNRFLKTQKMTSRSTLITIRNQNYYGLPVDFNGLRDIQISTVLESGRTEAVTMYYLSPEAMNEQSGDNTFLGRPAQRKLYYTIIADQLQISPTQENSDIEIVYYQKLPELSPAQPDNWLATENPDAYVFGLITEISAYAKDVEAKMLWDDRFKESLQQIKTDDFVSRWSGTALQVRI